MATAARREIFVNPDAATWKSQSSRKLNHDIQKFHASLPDSAVTRPVSLIDVVKELGVKRVLVKDETSRLGLPSF